jgi:hypothetical protein
MSAVSVDTPDDWRDVKADLGSRQADLLTGGAVVDHAGDSPMPADEELLAHLTDVAHDPPGVPADDCVRRDILCHDGAGPDP